MTVRFRIALTIFVTGLATALGVVFTVVVAFQRFEHESQYDRGNAFLGRVVAQHDDILDLQARDPEQFVGWLKSLLLFEPATQLYLLGPDGTVLASTCETPLAPGLKVAIGPVQQAVAAVQDRRRAPYVMGDDPEHMNADAVITARALGRALIRPSEPVAGYLYLVAQGAGPREGRFEMFRSSLAGPALASVLAVIVLTTALAAWIVASVTRPLRGLSQAVAAAAREGFNDSRAAAPPAPPRRDEFGQLHEGFQALLATLRQQWDTLRTLDRFRREGVSNLSHDLRSPLTATVACLETLEQRWAGDGAREADRQLVEVALRNTRNAAQLVRSLGDLALLDEPEFKLSPVLMDLGEVLDDITLRFADRARRQQVGLHCEVVEGAAPRAEVDIELLERAVANLVDNALKFTPAGGRIVLSAQALGGQVHLTVTDTGAGIEEADQAQLFDRLFQGSDARSEGGKGLGLAIVKRIAELHRGSVAVHSAPGQGTRVTITLPGR
jgi:signal transduction histidine kinase